MATIERSPTPERSLAPEVSRRVILRLVSGLSEPLTLDDAIKVNTKLHSGKDKLDRQRSTTTALHGKFYMEILEKASSTEEILARAVNEVDEAILETPVVAEIGEAWLAPADTPPLHLLTAEEWGSLEEVTPTAQTLFSEHHNAILDRALVGLLYTADGAA